MQSPGQKEGDGAHPSGPTPTFCGHVLASQAEAHNAALCGCWLRTGAACLGSPGQPAVPAMRLSCLGGRMRPVQGSRALGQGLSRKHLGWPGCF